MRILLVILALGSSVGCAAMGTVLQGTGQGMMAQPTSKTVYTNCKADMFGTYHCVSQ